LDSKKENLLKNEVVKDLIEIVPTIEISEIELLKSRKNLVLSLTLENPKDFPKKVIVKKMTSDARFSTETQNLKSNRMKGIPVPKILAAQRPYLIIEKIEGRNLTDLVAEYIQNKEYHDKLEEIFQSLAVWLNNYHETNLIAKNRDEIEVLNKGDLRLKNFIYTGNKIYGIDFEEVHKGPPENDLAEVIGSLITIDPGNIFTDDFLGGKIDLIREFLNKYDESSKEVKISLKKIVDLLYKYLQRVAKRREIEYNEKNLQKRMNRIVDELS